MKTIIYVLILLVIGGCSAPQVWKNRGVSLDQANKIKNTCLTEASADNGSSGNELQQRFSECMKQNGFIRASQWDDAPVNPWLDKSNTLW